MKKRIKIPLFVVFGIVVLAAVVRLILPTAAVAIANRQLPSILNTEASVGSLRLGLLRGQVSLGDLRIAQPEGFGEGDLLRVPELTLKVKLSSIFRPPLTVEEAVLTDWEVNLVKDRNGVMNIEKLGPPADPEPVTDTAPEVGEEPEVPVESEEDPARPILVRSFTIQNLAFSYVDYSAKAGEEFVFEEEEEEAAADEPSRGRRVTFPFLHTGRDTAREAASEVTSALPTPPTLEKMAEDEETPDPGETDEKKENVLRVRVAGLDLKVRDLLIDPAADPGTIEPAEAVLSARIVQEPFGDSLLGLAARIGPVGEGIPPLNAVLRLGGLELRPLRAVVPGGAALVLGGSALDISADLALADYLLDCAIEVEIAGGHSVSLGIGGTPDDPRIDTSSLLFGVFLHLGGGVGRLTGNIGGAGYQLASGAAGTTWAVGKGAVGMVGSLGGGLFRTVTSAATGDLGGVVGGLTDSTVGTVGRGVRTVGAAAGEVAGGGVSAAGAATGADGDRRWRENTPVRWEESWNQARESLAGMTFPPPPREEKAPPKVPIPAPANTGE